MHIKDALTQHYMQHSCSCDTILSCVECRLYGVGLRGLGFRGLGLRVSMKLLTQWAVNHDGSGYEIASQDHGLGFRV